MPDINPADLSRPAVGLSTPVLANKSITVSSNSFQKTKTSQIIPARIELEPVYTALKSAIGNEQWTTYKETLSQFLIGRLNQTEYADRIDPILASPNGEKEHLHNQLVAALYGNVTREMPDQGLAPWVSANDKPSTGTANKPVTGDAAERRLKGDVMQLPSRDRRRIKDLAHNDLDPYESLANVFTDHHKARLSRAADAPASAGGLNRTNWDLEIKKRFAQPLAVESGEFPDTSNVEARMLSFCYESGLVSGHAADAAHIISVATENFVKETLSTIFSRTRSNGPGDSGSAGFGTGAQWISTHRYRRQLVKEEEAALRGEIQRDKSGLLPIEAKAASERGPLGMTDMRIALDMGACGMSNFPIIHDAITYGYREGELENWEEYTFLDGREPPPIDEDVVKALPAAAAAAAAATTTTITTTTVTAAAGAKLLTDGAAAALPNGVDHSDEMDIDNDLWWEGAELQDGEALDAVLESCLAVG